MDFGTKLKELRAESGLTQKQLADQLGVSKSVVSFYERQERVPSPDVLRKLASIFRVSSDFLLDLDRVKRLDLSGLTVNASRCFTKKEYAKIKFVFYIISYS